MATTTAAATSAQKVAMYREKAKDTNLPQDVRNAYLDKATALEAKAYEETKAGETKSNTPPKEAYAKGGLTPRWLKPMKMSKGGSVNQGVGASMKPHDVFGSKGKK